MIVARKTRIVGNPKRAPRPRKRSKSKGNPVWLMTLGPANPAKRSKTAMAKPKRKKKIAIGRANPARKHTKKRSNHRRRSNPMGKKMRTRTVHVHHRSKNRRSSNPFGVNMSSKDIGEIAIGVAGAGIFMPALIGMVPGTLTSTAIGSILTTFAVSGVAWFAISKLNKNIGFGVGLGGLASGLTTAYNDFQSGSLFPSSSGTSGLRRGTGDLVPGQVLEPWNPLYQASLGMPAIAAGGRKYQAA